MENVQFEYLNTIAAYMLHVLAESQSMGKLLHAFKNVRNMDKFLEENAASADTHQGDNVLRYFAFHQLRRLPCEQRCCVGEGFSCLREGYVGPCEHF